MSEPIYDNSVTPDKTWDLPTTRIPTQGYRGGELSDFEYFALPLVLFIVAACTLFAAGFVCFLAYSLGSWLGWW